MSSVAISHGINANVNRKWLPLYRDQSATPSLPAFVPLKAAHKRPAEASVIIELLMVGQLQRIGEDVSEKLDYTPGVFTVDQYVLGKWACRQCETLI